MGGGRQKSPVDNTRGGGFVESGRKTYSYGTNLPRACWMEEVPCSCPRKGRSQCPPVVRAVAVAVKVSPPKGWRGPRGLARKTHTWKKICGPLEKKGKRVLRARRVCRLAGLKAAGIWGETKLAPHLFMGISFETAGGGGGGGRSSQRNMVL